MTTTSASAAPGPALRQFAFFDVVPVHDIHDFSSPPELLKSPNEVSCLAPSSFGLLLADIQGTIHLLGKDFEALQAWHAADRVTHMVVRQSVLVSIGEDDGVRFPLLKIWDLQKFDKKTGVPTLLRSVKVQHNNKPHPITTVALADSLSHLALGLADGTVLLYRHLDQALASGGGALSALPKPRALHEGTPAEPITGLGFRAPRAPGAALHLFVVTPARVLAYAAAGRGAGGAGAGHVVDELGAALGCAVMDGAADEIVLARDEAIYLCGTEGRGMSIAYEGHKASVHTHASYLVLVSPPFVPSAGSASATVRHFVRSSAQGAGASGAQEITKLALLDLQNKFVAHSGPVEGGVRALASVFGRLYVLSNTGQLLCVEEKPMAAKLEMLYQRGLYQLALALARTQELDAERTADVHRAYGDHLYGRGEHDGAMAQYVQTIGVVPPSYVIRKFLDAQRIHNLVTYLQELHARGLANADHTTLLLNAYTKLKDVARLESFIRTESKREGAELPFDLDTAIRVCRQAGYFDQAGYLAKKYDRHEDYLKILIEDSGKYKDAIAYIRRLGTDAAEANLARYGHAMLESVPDETTELLIDICTGTGPLAPEQAPEPMSSPTKQGTAASYLSFMALNRGTAADTAVPPSPTGTTVTAKPEPQRQGTVTDDAKPTNGASTPTTAAPPAAPPPKPVQRPSPRVYFAHFVDHLDRFVLFLETVAARRWGQALDGAVPGFVAEPAADEAAELADQVAVWNTLLELYLTLPAGAGANADAKLEAAFRAKALRLLQSAALPHDATHALVLCSTARFTPGLVLLWERLGMHEDVLRFWMDRHAAGEPGASAEVVRYLRLYGGARPQLYPLVLRFLTGAPALLAQHREDIAAVLEHIEAEKIMSPVAVVQVLSRNGVASVGLVKQWLMTRIKEAREEIRTDEQLTASYRAETTAKQKQTGELADPDAPRVFHVTRCAQCSTSLSLPAVHFMCNHSYHQRCLNDQETECPKCAQAHGVIREIRANNERMADQHDVFVQDVRQNGFTAVAAAFGRGVMNMPRMDEIA